MEYSTDLFNAPQEFLNLFKAGKEAARSGEKNKAHELFRQAIEIDPYHEQVWLWLASVVETNEDRLVCFENVLELNPSNPTARKQLQILEQKALDELLDRKSKHSKHHKKRRLLLSVIIFAILIGGAVGGAFAFGFL